MYKNGIFFKKELNKAFENMKLYFDNESTSGWVNFYYAEYFENGIGIDMNIDSAFFYYKKALEYGYNDAKNKVKELEAKLRK